MAVVEDSPAGQNLPAEESPAGEQAPAEGAGGEFLVACAGRLVFRPRTDALFRLCLAASTRERSDFSIARWPHDERTGRNGLGGPLRC
jgi:hypothetical protein